MTAAAAGAGAAATYAAMRDTTLDEVYFINPNATRARSQRRVKLAAARARLAALAAAGGGVFPAGGGAGGAGGALSEKELRKQQRMLRNRESAALSRKRKSDRIGELEIQVEALQEENRRLRQRVDRQEVSGDGSGSGSRSGSDIGDGKASEAADTTRPASSATAAWAPTNHAAMAALSATSIVVPSASTTTVVPATPPATDTDRGHDHTGSFFHLDAAAAIAAPSGCSATAAALSCSSSSFATNCFNIISQPAVLA